MFSLLIKIFGLKAIEQSMEKLRYGTDVRLGYPTVERLKEATGPGTTVAPGIMCATSARLQKELANLNNACNKILRNLTVDNSNMRLWTGYIVPEEAPYSKGAFKIEITFPPEYPFKPPKLIFRTPIYHPNIDEKGMICLPIITPENWKPATKIEHVLQALISLLHSPEIEHPLRSDVAEEYVKDIKKFMKTAEEHTRKYAEKTSNL